MTLFWYKNFTKKPYLELVFKSSGIVIGRKYIANDGRHWATFKKTNMAVFIPNLETSEHEFDEKFFDEQSLKSRKILDVCAVKEGRKTTIYYDIDSGSPQSLVTDDDLQLMHKEDLKLIYHVQNDNKLKRSIFKLIRDPDELALPNEFRDGAITLNSYQKLKNFKKLKPMVFTPTSMDCKTLNSFFETNVEQKLLKNPNEMWESLKPVLIVAVIGLTIIGIMFSI